MNLMRQLSEKLPKVSFLSHETHYITGAEILEWGTITEFKGQPIVPEQTYKYSYPVIQYANHYRRLKRAYVRRGQPGMEAYLQWIDKQVAAKKLNGQMKAVRKIIEVVNK